MYSEELKPPKDIDIKFHRLGSPLLNSLCLPLNGLYNPLDNEESSDYPLHNKFKNFDTTSNKCPNIDNLLSLNNNFGKIFIEEQLEGLLTFANTADYEITIKNLKISMKVDDNKLKNPEKPLEVNLPDSPVIIPSKKGYTIKIKSQLNYVAKYRIEINFHIRSQAYDQHYFKLKQRNVVKENTENYSIINGCVEFFLTRKLTFDSYNPFKINEFFYNSQVNKCFIEIRILNAIAYPLTILDLFLTPKNKKNEKIPLVQSLEQIKSNKYNKYLNDSKYLSLESDEQIRILFKIDNTDLFYESNKFVLNITWLNYFDFTPKIYTYEFSNNLNTYNEYYKMVITEKPNEDIILNQNFKIIINLQSKNLSKKYSITLSQDPIKDNENSTDREIEIIDIIEKKMELNAKTPSNNFVLICKSDILGNVYLPKLKFSLYEGDKNTPIENVYEELLCFNCISKK